MAQAVGAVAVGVLILAFGSISTPWGGDEPNDVHRMRRRFGVLCACGGWALLRVAA